VAFKGRISDDEVASLVKVFSEMEQKPNLDSTESVKQWLSNLQMGDVRLYLDIIG